LNEVGFLEHAWTGRFRGRFHYGVNVIEEIALGTTDGQRGVAFVIGDEAKDRNTATRDAVADFGC